MFGLPGLDDASNRAFAAKLMKYAGWRSVTYRGNGVFDVDYHFDGRATQDFLFPALPDNDLIIPFIAHPAPRRRLGAGDRAGVHRRRRAAARARMAGHARRAEGRPGLARAGPLHRHHRRRDPDQQQRGRRRRRTRSAVQLHWDVSAGVEQDPGDAHPPVVS